MGSSWPCEATSPPRTLWKFELEWFAMTLGDVKKAPWLDTSNDKKIINDWRIATSRGHETPEKICRGYCSRKSDRDHDGCSIRLSTQASAGILEPIITNKIPSQSISVWKNKKRTGKHMQTKSKQRYHYGCNLSLKTSRIYEKVNETQQHKKMMHG